MNKFMILGMTVIAAFCLWKADLSSDCSSQKKFSKLNCNAEVIQSPIGKAVRACGDFLPGDLILGGWGEPSLVRTQHTIQVDVNSHIIPEEPFTWLNHSCQPNCGLLICPEQYVLELHALRPINCGDELTVDYATFELEIDFMPEICLCGSENCRGHITGYKDLPETLRKSYGPFIAPYLEHFKDVE